MKIKRIEVANFRTLTTFALELGGSSAILIGENGSGKSTLLSAIARALGAERHFSKLDFSRPDQPVEVLVVLNELTESETSDLCEAVTFDEPPTLTLGVRATWDEDSEEVEVIHGLPAKSWRNGLSRRAR